MLRMMIFDIFRDIKEREIERKRERREIAEMNSSFGENVHVQVRSPHTVASLFIFPSLVHQI